MAVRFKTAVTGLMVLTGSLSAFSAAAAPVLTEAEILERWVLARCLSAGLTDEAAKRDASASAAGYFEFSRLPVETFEAADALVKEALGTRYRAKPVTGEKTPPGLVTMQCIDFSKSNVLERFIRETLNAKDRR